MFTTHLNELQFANQHKCDLPSLLYLQADMFLLSRTLGVSIRVFRLLQLGNVDFVTYYNDEGTNTNIRPTVTIISEDDRHYNILVP